VSNTWPLFHNREQIVSSEPSHLSEEQMSSWRNYIQSLMKKCRNLALYFFPKSRIGVECLTRGGAEFTLTTALFSSKPKTDQKVFLGSVSISSLFRILTTMMYYRHVTLTTVYVSSFVFLHPIFKSSL
jgi:hypothetical protein